MYDDAPIFTPEGILWSHTVLLQSLIVQLIETGALSVEDAERAFDMALQRAKKAADRLPDADRFMQHVHDNLKWDDFYRSAPKRKRCA
jgi:hypothetical protein